MPNLTHLSTAPVKVLGVIPARLASTRLSRKVLRPLLGEPLLAWVHRAASASPLLDRIVIAADSEEVMAFSAARGFDAILTSPDLPSGSDRLFAVSRQISAEIYVNIQGDEPLLEPGHIAALLAPFARPENDVTSAVAVTTLKVLCAPEEIDNPNAVKVVTASDGRALYFSRAAIPFHRDASNPIYFKHLGLYAYRRTALERFAALAPTPLELTERLEQLRLLENNISLYVTETPHDTIGVDTEEDLARVEAILRSRQA
jgi:3-deoxy-manno-octulosonate cytidylyltransferase (CMP-KDO synthetase)